MRMGLLTKMTFKYGEYNIQTSKETHYLIPIYVRFGVLYRLLVLWIRYC
jgi:hypothetical protein